MRTQRVHGLRKRAGRTARNARNAVRSITWPGSKRHGAGTAWGDGSNANAPDASAAAGMGACHLSDDVFVEGYFGDETERDAWHLLPCGMASWSSGSGHVGGSEFDPFRRGRDRQDVCGRATPEAGEIISQSPMAAALMWSRK